MTPLTRPVRPSRAAAARIARRALTPVALAICALSLSALATPRASTTASRAEQALRAALPAAATMGVGRDAVSMKVRTALTNERGRVVVHATQTVRGHRVWGAEAVVHSDRIGEAHIAASTLETSPLPTQEATLAPAQAEAIAVRTLGLAGGTPRARTELVVFPTRYLGSVKLAFDTASKQYRLDRRNSVLTTPPADAYVWAYEVHLFAKNRIDGVKDMKYVIDARTGALLRVDTGLQTLAPPNPPTPRDTDVAARGIGHSQWSGDVALDTTMHADGTFALIDRTRASQYNPYLHDGYTDIYGNPIYDADGLPIHAIGLQTLTETHEGADWTWAADNFWFDGNATDTWGDGRQFTMYPYGFETSANGQTAAVDAHYGMATAWDFYRNVFGRNGIDNQGTSSISTVHVVNYFGYYYDNAFWSDYVFGMFYSDGTRNAGTDPYTGGATTPNPDGFDSLTELDIIGHEMSHGVTAWSAGLIYDGESGGLNEANSDIFGSMVEAYATRTPGSDATIPATGTDWLMGAQISAQPLRTMIRPSTDGMSADNWYAGIKYLDVHYSSGPMNRCFYFLSQGASADMNAPSFSPYLPGGMTGIGNDHAARIWYKALTEYLTPAAEYADARYAAIHAALDLYGDGSAELAAVKNAFAAINVGSATDTPRVTIDFPLVHVPGTPLNPNGTGYFSRMPIVAMGTTTQLTADVHDATDTSVEWHLGGMPGAFSSPGFREVGGLVDDQGHYTADYQWGWHAMSVSSQADPLEYAEGVLWVVSGDADADTEFDAMDLGAVALSWGLDGYVNKSHSIVGDGFVDSMDVTAIVEAFRNAFGGL
jgi:Zn-dependent metalloprotease